MKDTIFIKEQGEWMDIPRSRALWDSVFAAPKALIKRGDWIDQPSVGIPYLYIATGATLAQVLSDRGDVNGARNVFNTTRDIATAVRIQSSLGGIMPESAPSAAAPAITGDTRAPGKTLPVTPKSKTDTKGKTKKP
jgi:hypothetical protein